MPFPLVLIIAALMRLGALNYYQVAVEAEAFNVWVWKFHARAPNNIHRD